MFQRIARFGIMISLLIIQAAAPSAAQTSATPIAMRLSPKEAEQLDQAGIIPALTIDYGSFIWTVFPQTTLPKLKAAGFSPPATENPYILDLGGQRFDPLFSVPTFPSGWQKRGAASENPGLQLIQFQGPIKTAWLTALQENDLQVVQYIHPFTYVVWGDPAALQNIRIQPQIRWIGQYQPAYAVQPQWRGLDNDPIAVRVIVSRYADLAQIRSSLQSLRGLETGLSQEIDPAFTYIGAVLPGDQLQAAAALPGVYSLQPVPMEGGNRGEMSNQINVGNYDGSNLVFPGYLNWLAAAGLSGSGVVIANVDDGIDETHPDLINRMLPCSGTTCGGSKTGFHGTHTAGIMAGDAASGTRNVGGFLRGLGMAPSANLIEQLYYPTYLEETGVYQLMVESWRNGAVISGNSWGPSGSALGYDADTRLVDIGVRDSNPGLPGNQPLSYILSIMNGGGGVSTQGTPDEGKNIFTIGSTWAWQYGGSQSLRINDLSPNTAHGPALDGRCIPHMVAPGYLVDSTWPSASYRLNGGTSMASPQVSGAAALFYEKYRHLYGLDPSPALVKAAFLAVAHDLAGNLDADGITLGHPFDSKQGWGRMNAAAVLTPSKFVGYYDQPITLDETGDTWQITLKFEQPITYLHVMLVWTDAPGHGLGGSTPAWNNDLDLSLSNEAENITYLGNQFDQNGFSLPGGVPDGMNNTEGIFLPPSPAGAYTITVTAANIASDGVPAIGDETDQDFALVYYSDASPSGMRWILPLIYK